MLSHDKFNFTLGSTMAEGATTSVPVVSKVLAKSQPWKNVKPMDPAAYAKHDVAPHEFDFRTILLSAFRGSL